MPAASARELLAYLNGDWIPARSLSVAVHDAGFVWGATITDLCRTVRHHLYRWDDHLARFRRGCQYAYLDLAATDSAITEAATKLTAHNVRLTAEHEDLILVLFATPGPIAYYAGQSGGAGDARATFGMHTFPLPRTRYRALFERGAPLVIPPTRHIPAECLDPQVKQRSRLHWWRAEHEARAVDPGASALLLDRDGHVTETAAANFLIVRGGVICSPPRAAILEGVSLQVLRELSSKLNVAFEERPLTLEDCLAAEEALLTSTPYGVAGVSRINGRPIPWPGPTLRRLQAAWNATIQLDIAAQILGDGV